MYLIKNKLPNHYLKRFRKVLFLYTEMSQRKKVQKTENNCDIAEKLEAFINTVPLPME
jgi:hypothetical protein